MSAKKEQSAGREANDALPAGERPGLVSSEGVTRTGLRERRTAGPDGPDAGVIGETFKHPPGENSEHRQPGDLGNRQTAEESDKS